MKSVAVRGYFVATMVAPVRPFAPWPSLMVTVCAIWRAPLRPPPLSCAAPRRRGATTSGGVHCVSVTAGAHFRLPPSFISSHTAASLLLAIAFRLVWLFLSFSSLFLQFYPFLFPTSHNPIHFTMADNEQDLLDYEEDEEQTAIGGDLTVNNTNNNGTGNDTAKKAGYVSIHSSGFRDFLLKPELLRAIVDCGFEHPRFDLSYFVE
jgi:hypothetical protein